VPVGPEPTSVTYDAGNGFLYVVCQWYSAGPTNVTIINGTTVIGQADVGREPYYAAYDGRNGAVYVANAGSQNVSVIPPYYAVTFTESGLPHGSAWSVRLNGTALTSTASSLALGDPNGTYGWVASAILSGLMITVSGTVTVNGKGATVPVAFELPPQLTPLTFRAAGLSPNANWSVTLTPSSAGLIIQAAGGVTRWSGGASLVSFEVSPGEYNYVATTLDRASQEGNVTVSGSAPVNVTIVFGPTTTTGPPSSSSLPEWAAAVGIVLVLIGAVGLGTTVYRSRARQQEWGRSAADQLLAVQWESDPEGNPIPKRSR